MAQYPFGARPVGDRSGNPYSGTVNWYYCPAADGTPLFVGDFVKSLAAGAAASLSAPMGYVSVIKAAATDLLRGVVTGFSLIAPSDAAPKSLVASATDPGLGANYRPANTAMWVAVVDNPDVLFEILEDGDTSSIDENDIGKNADIVVTASDAAQILSGRSKTMIDSSDVKTATAQLRIVALKNDPAGVNALDDNAAGNSNVFYVYINEHEFAGTVGTGT